MKAEGIRGTEPNGSEREWTHAKQGSIHREEMCTWCDKCLSLNLIYSTLRDFLHQTFLSCDSRECTGVTNNINNGSVPFFSCVIKPCQRSSNPQRRSLLAGSHKWNEVQLAMLLAAPVFGKVNIAALTDPLPVPPSGHTLNQVHVPRLFV